MANNQVDLNPGTSGNKTGLHFHGPTGASASDINDPSSFPSVPANSTAPKAVSTKIAGTPGLTIKFSNPA